MAGSAIMAEYLQRPNVVSISSRYSSLELTFWQNVLGIMLTFLVSPFIELAEGRYMTDWKKDLYEGFLCLLNHDSLQTSERTDCSVAAKALMYFVPFMMSYNLMINIVPRICGSTPLFLVAALCLPVQNLLLSSSIMGKYKSDPLVWYNICGLFCILLFELIYANEMRKLSAIEDKSVRKKKQDDESLSLLESEDNKESIV